MSITRSIAIASGFAFALLAGNVAPAGSAPIASPVVASHVQVTAAADVTSASVGMQSLLTASEMSLIQGNGFWQKVRAWVDKQIRWVQHFWGEVQRVINQIRRIIDVIEGHDNENHDTVIQEENVVTTNEYYASDEDLDAGNLSHSDQSETGFYTASVTYSGGGGGSTCIQESGCEYMQ